MPITFAVGILLLIALWWSYRTFALPRTLRRCRPRQGPIKPFKPTPPRRRSGGTPKPAWAIEEVLALHALSPGGYRQIAASFNRLHANSGVTIAYSTVRNWLKKYSAELQIVQEKLRHQVPYHTPSNLRWCIDATGKTDATGRQHFIFGIVDHGSRKNLALLRMADQSAQALLQQIFQACRTYGKPNCIRTDNASVFRSVTFRTGLSTARIRHEFSEPGKPWQNGRIERFFLSLKQKLDRILPADGTVLDQLLAEFREWYNELRPHQHLHGLTPAEVRQGLNPYRRRPASISQEQ